MEAAMEKLLTKKRLTGKDVGRLMLANLIDIYNERDGGMSDEQINGLLERLNTYKDRYDYQLYSRAFHVLDDYTATTIERMKQTRLACQGLGLAQPMTVFATGLKVDEPNCQENVSRMEKRETIIKGLLASANDFKGTIIENSKDYHIVKTLFELSEGIFKVNGLKSMLPDYAATLKMINNANVSAEYALHTINDSRSPRLLLDEAKYILSPVDVEITIPDKSISQAKKILKIPTFPDDIPIAYRILYEAIE